MSESHSTWRTSGLIQLTRPQMIGTLSGLMLAVLLAGVFVLNILLKDVPLRHGPAPGSAPPNE